MTRLLTQDTPTEKSDSDIRKHTTELCNRLQKEADAQGIHVFQHIINQDEGMREVICHIIESEVDYRQKVKNQAAQIS